MRLAAPSKSEARKVSNWDNPRPMNLKRVLRTYHALVKEYTETGLVSIHPDGIQVRLEALVEVAEPEVWRWNRRIYDDSEHLWEAVVTYKGVFFCALATQQEYEQFSAAEGER